MRRSQRRGIFFDLDGTLADSAGVMRLVFTRFAEECGVEPEETAFDAVNGPPLPVVVAALKQRWALRQSLDWLQRRYAALVDAAFRDVRPAPEAAATLEAACRHGWSVAVVTSNTAARTHDWLARMRLHDFIDVVISGDEVCLGKPEPEPYRMALARTSCIRELSMAIEDTLTGARAAIAAGIRTYGYAPESRAAVAGPEIAGSEIDWPENVRLIGSLGELIPELERPRTRRIASLR